MKARLEGGKGKKMKGDCEGKGEEAYKNDYGRPNNGITVSRRNFVKTSAAFGAAVAGIPYNLTDITDVFLKEEGELILYPHLHRFINKIFQVVNIKLWGCNWNCQYCINKYPPFKGDNRLNKLGVFR